MKLKKKKRVGKKQHQTEKTSHTTFQLFEDRIKPLVPVQARLSLLSVGQVLLHFVYSWNISPWPVYLNELQEFAISVLSQIRILWHLHTTYLPTTTRPHRRILIYCTSLERQLSLCCLLWTCIKSNVQAHSWGSYHLTSPSGSVKQTSSI